MSPPEEEFHRLRELVGDERARRARTEKQLAEQRAETSRWRRRARRAEMAAKVSLRLPTLRPRRPTPEPVTRRRIAFPAVRAGVHGVPSWLHRGVETVSLAGADEAALAMLDVVVVGGDSVPAGLAEWLEWPGRQPLVAWAPSGDLAELLAGTECDVVVGSSSVPARHRMEVRSPLERMEPSPDHGVGDVARRVHGGVDLTIPVVTHGILRAAGIDLPEPRPSVTAVAITNRPERMTATLQTLREMSYPGLQVQLATHGFQAEADARASAERWFADRIVIRELPESWTLGRCLNHVVESTTTDVWAKIDDDDFYGPLYLQEAIVELETGGADLVGKQSHYLYDSAGDRTYLMQPGNEYRETSYVPGATFVGRRRAWEEVPFAHRRARVDSTFVRGVRAVGMSIYSTSRFEFAVGRGEAAHTWHLDESFFRSRGRLIADGWAGEEIFLPDPGHPGPQRD